MQPRNPLPLAEASLTTMEEAAHDRSYWARIVRKSGDIEYRYIRKEEKDLMKLKAAHKKGDVKDYPIMKKIEVAHIILDCLKKKKGSS